MEVQRRLARAGDSAGAPVRRVDRVDDADLDTLVRASRVLAGDLTRGACEQEQQIATLDAAAAAESDDYSVLLEGIEGLEAQIAALEAFVDESEARESVNALDGAAGWCALPSACCWQDECLIMLVS